MARLDKKTNEIVFESNNRAFDAVSEYRQTVMHQIDKMGDVIANSDKGYANPQIDMQMQFIMNLIIDEDKVNELYNYKQRTVDDKIHDDMDSDTKNKEMFTINMRTLGHCIREFDNFLGIMRKQEIMRVSSKELETLEKKALEKYQ